MILKTSIEKLMRKQDLDAETCRLTMDEILKPKTNPLQISAFLVLLRTKGETAEELSGIISALKQKMITIQTKHKVLDLVGTGGDGAHTVNISTGSAILAAACGVKIAKHGSRASSSKSGSADVLEALGININLAPEKISACIDSVGIGFCFFPNFHPLMKGLGALRKQLNVPTSFNLLGPLLNPANPAYMLLGVYDESLMPLIANYLKQSNTERSFVVHGCGLDEISCVGTAKIIEVTQTSIITSEINPEKYGFSLCQLKDLRGSDAKTNADILLNIFSGSDTYPAIRDTLILNTATALYLYGLSPSIESAIPIVQEKLAHKAALSVLNHWREFSHE